HARSQPARLTSDHSCYRTSAPRESRWFGPPEGIEKFHRLSPSTVPAPPRATEPEAAEPARGQVRTATTRALRSSLWLQLKNRQMIWKMELEPDAVNLLKRLKEQRLLQRP